MHKDLDRTSQGTQDASVRKHSHITLYWKIMGTDYKYDMEHINILYGQTQSFKS
jgi:hypothetical protein